MSPALTIISGGQTGADRAALDWAIEHGVPHGGWCPKGRKAEDGPLNERYMLKETPSANYEERTRFNVRDSDGTAISSKSPLTGGTKLTMDLAIEMGKPVAHIDKCSKDAAPELAGFISQHGIKRLNVAGPRASVDSEICGFLQRVLTDCFLGRAAT